MDNTPVIETERLRLRRFTERDAEALFTILSDPEVNQFLPMFPLTSLEEAGQYLKEHYLSTYEQPSGYHYAVCLKQMISPSDISTSAMTTATTWGTV